MEESRQISEFNESLLQIGRLHQQWMDIARLKETGQFERCRWKLDSVEEELNHDAIELDERNNTNFVQQLSNLNMQLNITINKGFVYLFLGKKVKLLRKIQQDAGKGSKYKSADEDKLD